MYWPGPNRHLHWTSCFWFVCVFIVCLFVCFRVKDRPHWHDILPLKLSIWLYLSIKNLPQTIQVCDPPICVPAQDGRFFLKKKQKQKKKQQQKNPLPYKSCYLIGKLLVRGSVKTAALYKVDKQTYLLSYFVVIQSISTRCFPDALL